DWLLQGEPCVVYRTLRDLCGEPEDAPEVLTARAAMLAEPAVRAVVDSLAEWPGVVINSHRSPTQPFHRLSFLADLGLTAGDPGMAAIVSRVRADRSAEGIFTLPLKISESYGGTGEAQHGWALCDAPVTVSALARLRLGGEPDVLAARDALMAMVRDNGWPCALSANIPWRGPGRKDDPCPYATLAMLKVAAAWDDTRGSDAARTGAETLLTLWAESRERHPYMFYMGTNFRQLKVPYVWYDLMHVIEVLTQFPWLRGDPRLQEMLDLLAGKADAAGRFTPESVWMHYKAWEFGQKKAPSRWLTLLAHRALARAGG
ncbi:MAG: hypothetical protein ACYCYF_06955, partial [Anaerolineae bacterium]